MANNNKREYIGITRQVDQLGRIVIPVEIRRELDIDLGEELEIKIALLNKRTKVIEIRKKGEE